MRYLCWIEIDQRPGKKEWVSQKIFNAFERLGWLESGKVVLLEKDGFK